MKFFRLYRSFLTKSLNTPAKKAIVRLMTLLGIIIPIIDGGTLSEIALIYTLIMLLWLLFFGAYYIDEVYLKK